jgi:putative hydrolase of the HAD superfamily
MAIKTVLLDLDDTLFDKAATQVRFAERQFRLFIQPRIASAPVRLDAWREAFVVLNNQKITKQEVFRRLGRRFLLPNTLSDTLQQDLDAHFHDEAVACPGAQALLQSLHEAGVRTAVITNGRDVFQRAKLAALGLTPWLDAVVTSGELGIKKPDPRFFHTALQRVGGQASTTAVVGDDIDNDVRAARALGMLSIHKSAVQLDAEADFSADSLFEIRDFLLSRIAPVTTTESEAALSF